MAQDSDPVHDLANELLAAVRGVGKRHRLNPQLTGDCIVLTSAFAEVLMALVNSADPEADSIVISKADDGLGVVVTVHTPAGYFDVVLPKEMLS